MDESSQSRCPAPPQLSSSVVIHSSGPSVPGAEQGHLALPGEGPQHLSSFTLSLLTSLKFAKLKHYPNLKTLSVVMVASFCLRP